jgi:imidazolonepropionase
MTDYILVHDAAQLVRNADGDIDAIHDAAVAIEDGTVVATGPTADVTEDYPASDAETTIDASGKTVLPGYVDPHTHAAFAGDRADEFTAKLRGKTYQEISEEGGGILRTVRAVREVSQDELVERLLGHLDAMLALGTTTAEVKSGYGLTVEAELKLLRAIDEVAQQHPVDVVPTFMGAHEVPDRLGIDEYVDTVIDEQLPAVATEDLAEFCDIFCEAGVFSVEQSRRVLKAGKDHGLTPKIHADEFENIGGSKLAAEIGAASADHLLQSTAEGAEAIAEADVVPVMLPGTAFTLATDYTDPELFQKAGRPVAIATDFNPNCHSTSMEFAIDLACHGMRMEPAAAIRAATVVAAEAIDRTDGTGTLQDGAPGDLVVADAEDFEHIPYSFGVSTTELVVKGGEVVHDAR